MLNMNYAIHRQTAQRWLSLLRIVPLSYAITFLQFVCDDTKIIHFMGLFVKKCVTLHLL